MRVVLAFAALCASAATARSISGENERFHLHARNPQPNNTPPHPVFPDGLTRQYTCLKESCVAVCPDTFTSVEAEWTCVVCAVGGFGCNGKAGELGFPATKARDMWLLPAANNGVADAMAGQDITYIGLNARGLIFNGVPKYPHCVADTCAAACPGEVLKPEEEPACRTCLRRHVPQKKRISNVKCPKATVRMVFLGPSA